jgi:hypothetical protein
MARNPGRFTFDGGAATFVGTALLGGLITVCTLGICYPFALVLMERWRAKHCSIDGHRLVFTGTATGLFGLWIKWFLLCVVTLGIYSFWVVPRLTQWRWEHTGFDPAGGPHQPGSHRAVPVGAMPGWALPVGAAAPATQAPTIGVSAGNPDAGGHSMPAWF